MFDFEEERIKEEIVKLGAKRVLLQLPEGLKPEASRLVEPIEETGALPIISADPCYGACDLATSAAEDLDVDLIVHFGHAKLLKQARVPTLYIEARTCLKLDEAVEKALPLLAGFNRIGLATTVQHARMLDSVKKSLTRGGKTVIVGNTGRLPYAGQVIGCDYSNVKVITSEVDAYLFVGGGKFHALGVALATGKSTIVADPYDQTAFSVDREAHKIIRQRWASIQSAMKADVFGVLISLKLGQMHLDLALDIKNAAEKIGRKAYLFALREILPETLIAFPTVDVYLNTACPRISLDDTSKFLKPVLTASEFRVVSGEISWENLLKEGLFER